MERKIVVITVFALCFVVNLAAAASPSARRINDGPPRRLDAREIRALTFRLPNETWPKTYTVSLVTDFDQNVNEFSSTVDIVVTALEATQMVVLNARLEIVQVELFHEDMRPIQSTFTLDPDKEILEITSGEMLQPSTDYVVRVQSKGSHSTGTSGFYRSTYAEAGVVVPMVSTQFQPVDARLVFPCYDEPRFRAQFIIKITHNRNFNALSNMPGTVNETTSTHATTTFLITPPMPTYLIAFAVSKMDNKSRTGRHLVHRVFARSEDIEQTTFALDTGIRTMDAQEDYFRVRYPLPKIDQLAAPRFQAGAMENWGLVIYREDYLLIEEGVSTTDDVEIVAATIAHEFAHNYFGNLVTPQWWSTLWLSEGMATLYEYYSTHSVYPEMRMNEKFTVEIMHEVFWRDSLESARPMTMYVETPEAIDGMFDSISYSKAGCVLRMMLHALGETTFTNGLYNYLDANMYKAVVPGDLYEHLNAAAVADQKLPAGVTIANIMESWELVAGYPVLRVTRNYDTNQIDLHQERYFARSDVDVTGTTWWLPFNYAMKMKSGVQNVSAVQWIPKGVKTIKLSFTADFGPSEWVLFNHAQTGYYRVNYDRLNWLLIAEELTNGNHEAFAPVNRAQLIDDSANLARSGRLGYDIAMTMMDFLHREEDYIVWMAANNNLDFISTMIAAEPYYAQFKEIVANATRALFNMHEVDEKPSDSHMARNTRILLAQLSCKMGLKDCLEKSLAKFNASMSSSAALETNLEAVVYCNAMRAGGETEFQMLWTKLRNTTDTITRDRMIKGLACTEDRQLLDALVLTTTVDSSQDVRYVGNEAVRLYRHIIGTGRHGLEAILNYTMEHSTEVIRKFGPSMLNSVMTDLANVVVNQAHVAQFEELLSEVNDTMTAASLDLIASRIETNKVWLSRNGDNLKLWLDMKMKDNSAGHAAVSKFVFLITALLSLCVAFA